MAADRGCRRERAGNDRGGEEQEKRDGKPDQHTDRSCRRWTCGGPRLASKCGGSVLRRPAADLRPRSTLVRLTVRWLPFVLELYRYAMDRLSHFIAAEQMEKSRVRSLSTITHEPRRRILPRGYGVLAWSGDG